MRDGDVPSDSAASAKAHPIKRYIIICRLSCDILCPTTTTSTALCIVEFVNAERGRVSLERSKDLPPTRSYGHPRPLLHDYSFSD
jgi:hypothetical protein